MSHPVHKKKTGKIISKGSIIQKISALRHCLFLKKKRFCDVESFQNQIPLNSAH